MKLRITCWGREDQVLHFCLFSINSALFNFIIHSEKSSISEKDDEDILLLKHITYLSPSKTALLQFYSSDLLVNVSSCFFQDQKLSAYFLNVK